MSQNNISRSDKFQAIRELIDLVIDENASNEQVAQLDRLLVDNEEAQRFYYDYIGMNMELKSAAKRNTEFVYRRMTEEFIVRPNSGDTSHFEQSQTGSIAGEIDVTGKTGTDNPEANASTNSSANSAFNPVSTSKIDSKLRASTPQLNESSPPPLISNKNTLVTALALFTALFAIITAYTFKQTNENFIAEIIDGQFKIVDLGEIKSGFLYPGEYQTEQQSTLKLKSGEVLKLSPHTQIKFFNNNEIQIKQGLLSLAEPIQHNNIVVHARNFSTYSNGGKLVIDLTAKQPIVTSGEHTQISPNRWRPNHYWSFDGNGNRAKDSAGNADGIPSSSAVRHQGLLGQGAFDFNNTAKARIHVGNGGGNAPATGSFSVTEGVTIEALIQPRFSGEPGEIDTVFRKDQSDKQYRMLLTFKNTPHNVYIYPEGDFKESLSFGLYLLGQGYQELLLPLDGHNGRPTLAQINNGKSHHIVATYDVKTGVKAIYINGKQHAVHQYPQGSKMLSGGKGIASIGNNPNQPRWAAEAFDGVIDEVAFYNFALPPYMVTRHFDQINNNVNYFGLWPSDKALPPEIKIPLPKNIRITIDASTGLPSNLLGE